MTVKSAKPSKSSKASKASKPAKVKEAKVSKAAASMDEGVLDILNNMKTNIKTLDILKRRGQIGILLNANKIDKPEREAGESRVKQTGFKCSLAGITKPTALIIEVDAELNLVKYNLTETVEQLVAVR